MRGHGAESFPLPARQDCGGMASVWIIGLNDKHAKDCGSIRGQGAESPLLAIQCCGGMTIGWIVVLNGKKRTPIPKTRAMVVARLDGAVADSTDKSLVKAYWT